MRVETASGTGFIPVNDPADATYPYLRVQSQNNGIVAVTDTAGDDIPDSAINHWETPIEGLSDNDTVTTWPEQVQNADISGTNLTYSETVMDNTAGVVGNGTDSFGSATPASDYADVVSGDFAQLYTVNGEANNQFFDCRDTFENSINIRLDGPGGATGDRPLVTIVADGDRISAEPAQSMPTNSTFRFAFNKIGTDPSNWEFYYDGSDVGTNVVEDEHSTAPQSLGDFNFYRSAADVRYWDGALADIVFTNNALSAQEMQDDFNRQPWS